MKRQLDRFTILEPLGSGGAGSVYRADENLPGGAKRTVALKVLPAIPAGDRASESRFHAEVRAFAALTGHPNIVTFYSLGLTDGTPWIAMEYVPANLTQKVVEHPAPPVDVLGLLRQVLSGLEFMHAQSPPLLHNDLKPANILIDAYGTYRITDFSLASLIAADRTHVLATVRYAAPELLSREFGRVCPATDLYALGLIAYELALGGRAYRLQFPAVFEASQGSRDAPPAKWMAWHCSLTTKPAPVSDVIREFPRDLSDVIARMTAKPLGERYASAREVLDDLANVRIAQTEAAPKQASAFQQALKSVPVPPPPSRTGGGGAAGGAAAKPASPDRFYVRLRGKTTGPFDLPTLQRQARQGQISRLHQVSNDGVSWRPATTVEGLFGNSTAAQ